MLIEPVASPAAVRFARVPQHGVALRRLALTAGATSSTHRDTKSCGLVPPCARSYWISRSPAVRTGVTPLLEMVDDWLNSKSMFVVPLGSWTRCQNMCRNLSSSGSSRGRCRRSAGRSCSAGCCRRRRTAPGCPPSSPGRTSRRPRRSPCPASVRRRRSAQSIERGRRRSTLRFAFGVDLEVAAGQAHLGMARLGGARRDDAGEHESRRPRRSRRSGFVVALADGLRCRHVDG